jgi:tryptophanyl-tRNA synthetase
VYGDTFVIPEAVVDDKAAVLAGLDGRKMSKSYNNTIPLFAPQKRLRKLIMKIKTNSLEPGEPKDPDDCTLFDIYKAFATSDQTAAYRQQLLDGMGWGDAKQALFEYLDAHLAGPRAEYERLVADPAHVETVLREGAGRAREYSTQLLSRVRKAVGLQPLA